MASPGDETLVPLVRKLSKWAQLDAQDEKAVLALPFDLKIVPPHNYIVREGDAPKQSALLVSGFAYRQKIVGNGGRQILALHMRGDVVDLQNSLLRLADHSVQALTKAEVAFIPRQAVLDLAFSRPRVGFAMWYDTLVDASVHREWTANIGRRDAPTRIAHLLCEFGLRLEEAGLGQRGEYELPMTQEQLADSTGLTAVHVNRTLMSLDREELTDRNKRAVIIKDWDRLAEVGDFSSGYLHLPNGVPTS
jgi:CRP-like cAMP-binding protein